MSEPLEINETDINLDSAFQRATTLQDFRKPFLHSLKEMSSEVDFLLIDFVDERFDLLQHKNSFITRSNELIECGLADNHIYIFSRIIRDAEATHLLWEKACLKFIDQLTQILPANKIILNIPHLSSKYRNNNGAIEEFEEDYLLYHRVEPINTLLNRYNTFFQKNMPGINVIALSPEEYISDADHLWGPGPYHYVRDSYISLFRQLQGICCPLEGGQIS